MQADFPGAWRYPLLAAVLLLGACGLSSDPQARMERATSFFEQSDYRSSTIELKNLLSDDPAHRPARLLLARVHIGRGDGESAEKELGKARDLGAGVDEYLAPLAQALYLQGAYQRLLDEIDADQPVSDEDRSLVLALRGNAYRELKQLSEATQMYNAALQINDRYPAALVGLASVEHLNGNLENARGYVEQVLADDDTNADAWFILGELETRSHNYEEAESAFRRSIELTRNTSAHKLFLRAHVELIQLALAQERTDTAEELTNELAATLNDNPLPHFFMASIAYQKKDYPAALAAIQEFRSQAPDYMQGKLLDGAINYELGNYEKANRLLSSVSAQQPDNLTARKLLAATKLGLSEPEKAEDILSSALQGNTEDTTLFTLAAKASLQTGHAEEAIAYLEDALRKTPDNPRLKEELAAAQLEAGKIESALETLNSVPALDKEDGAINRRDLLIIKAYLKEKDYTAATRHINLLLQTHSDDARLLNLAGIVHMRAGELDAAQQFFEQSIARQEDYRPALMNLARMAYRQKDYDKAEVELRRLHKVDPKNASVLFALASLAESQGKRTQAIDWLERIRSVAKKSVEPRLLLTRFYVDQGQYKKAYDVIKEARRINPKRVDVLNATAIIQMKRGKTKQALETFNKAATLAPNTPQIELGISRAQLQAGDTEGARTTLKHLLMNKPDQFSAVSLLAMIEVRTGNIEEALKIVRDRQKNGANIANAYALEGDIHMVTGEYRAAVDAYDKSAELSAGPEISVKRFNARRKAGISDPYQPLEQWLKQHPDDSRIRLVLADTYFGDGMKSQAARHYEIITTNEPDNATAFNNLALIYQDSKDPRAVKMAEKAHALRPDEGAITDTLGWLLVQHGKYQRAADILRKATLQEPAIPDIRYHYAVALAKVNRKDEARRVLTELISSGARFDDLAEAKKLLGGL